MSRPPATWTRPPTFTHNPHHPPACRNHNPELWFPAPGEQAHQAKAICATCPLLQPCRDWATEQPPHLLAGIWGGTTAADRRRMKRHRP